jgi:hypothetical protein
MSERIYPRSPRETMDGWHYLPRYIDKITHEQMIEVVRNSITDGQIFDWVRQNVKKSPAEKAAHWEDMLSRPKPGDEAAQARLKMRKEQCGGAHRDDVRTFVDVIDLDEKRI